MSTDYIRATGAVLRTLATGGDTGAEAELARRAAKRAAATAPPMLETQPDPWHIRGAPKGTAPHGLTYTSLVAATDALSALVRTWPVGCAEGVATGTITLARGAWPLTTSPRPEPAPERTAAPRKRKAETVDPGPPGLVAMFATPAPKRGRNGGAR